MNGYWRRCRQSILCAGFISALPFFSGCTPEKARQLNTAAVQFSTNAHEAIAAIRGLMDTEIAPPTMTDAQRADQFVSNVLAIPESVRLNSDTMDLAIDPYSVKLSSAATAARNALIDGLSQDYSAFSAMFENLERGSFLAQNKVAKTKRYAAMLTAQMVGIAKVLADNPPRLIQQRTAVLTQVEKVRRNQSLSPDQKRQALSELMSRWLDIKAQELALQQDVVGKCLLAASSGKNVLDIAESYKRLSVDDIARLTTGAFSLAEQISGKSLNDLKSRTQGVSAFLEANPDYKSLADSALAKVQSQLVSGAK